MSLRILVVDDEAVVAEGLRSSVEALGHEVVGVAADGHEAVSMAFEARPQIIIMDIRLPKMDGIDTAARINRDMPAPIILITGQPDNSFTRRAMEAGVYSYLIKPVDESDLGPAIDIAYSTHLKMTDLEHTVTNLSEEIAARKIIERAKGILMKKFGLDEPEAMRRLQQESRRRRKKMVDVARSLVEAEAFL